MGFSLILIFIPLLLPHSPFSFLSAVEKGKGMWQKKIMKSDEAWKIPRLAGHCLGSSIFKPTPAKGSNGLKITAQLSRAQCPYQASIFIRFHMAGRLKDRNQPRRVLLPAVSFPFLSFKRKRTVAGKKDRLVKGWVSSFVRPAGFSFHFSL